MVAAGSGNLAREAEIIAVESLQVVGHGNVAGADFAFAVFDDRVDGEGIVAHERFADGEEIEFLDAFGGKADAPAKEHVELETGFAAEAQERGDVELFEKGDHGVGRVHPEGIGAGAFGLRWVDLIHASLLLLREWEGIIREKGRKCQGAEGK